MANNICGKCKYLTNVFDEKRAIPNVMGGCFIDGHITFTDCKACEKFKILKNKIK